jgi:hypothetical protein
MPSTLPRRGPPECLQRRHHLEREETDPSAARAQSYGGAPPGRPNLRHRLHLRSEPWGRRARLRLRSAADRWTAASPLPPGERSRWPVRRQAPRHRRSLRQRKRRRARGVRPEGRLLDAIAPMLTSQHGCYGRDRQGGLRPEQRSRYRRRPAVRSQRGLYALVERGGS